MRDYHIDIKGVDDQGPPLHALNPDVFYWAHSTFFMGTILVAERFGGGLTEDEKRQLFDEHITWYRMYGMSMRPVPKTWEEFQVYWDHMCRNVLGEQLRGTRGARPVDDAQTSVAAMDSRLAVAAAAESCSGPSLVWVTVGLYDPAVRELMGYTWSAPRRAAAPALRQDW